MIKPEAKMARIAAYLHAELDDCEDFTYTFSIVPRGGHTPMKQMAYGPTDEVLTSLTLALAGAATESHMRKSQIIDAFTCAYDMCKAKMDEEDDSDMKVDTDVSITGINLETGKAMDSEEALLKLAEALQAMAKKKKNENR